MTGNGRRGAHLLCLPAPRGMWLHDPPPPSKEFWAIAREENGLVSGLQDHRYLSVSPLLPPPAPPDTPRPRIHTRQTPHISLTRRVLSLSRGCEPQQCIRPNGPKKKKCWSRVTHWSGRCRHPVRQPTAPSTHRPAGRHIPHNGLCLVIPGVGGGQGVKLAPGMIRLTPPPHRNQEIFPQEKKKKLIEGARNWRSILGTQILLPSAVHLEERLTVSQSVSETGQQFVRQKHTLWVFC